MVGTVLADGPRISGQEHAATPIFPKSVNQLHSLTALHSAVKEDVIPVAAVEAANGEFVHVDPRAENDRLASGCSNSSLKSVFLSSRYVLSHDIRMLCKAIINRV